MATHDYVIANASGAAVRADLNNVLAAIVSNNSNATEPATKYAYQWWADTNAGILKFRNAANDAWIDIIQLDGEYTKIGLEDGSAAAPSLFFKDSGTDTGLYSPGADSVAISTGGTERLKVDSSGRLLINTSAAFFVNTAGFVQIEGTATDPSPGIALQRNDTAVSVDDHIGNLSFFSNDGGVSVQCARINAEASQTHTADNRGTALRFAVTKDDTNTFFEAMALNDDGRLRLFTSNDTGLVVRSASTSASDRGIVFMGGGTSLGDGGATKFRVLCNGDVDNTNNSYGAISDVKLKENIVDAGSQWADLKALRVRKFNFKEELGYGAETHIGLIAQEVELVSPGLVKDTTDVEEYQDPVLDSKGSPVLDDDGNPVVDTKERATGEATKKVSYSVLYMKAVKALQEAMERIEQLETKVAALEGGAG